MLANDGAEEEYLNQLAALGYQNTDIQEMITQRESQSQGMLKLGCRRIIQRIPTQIASIRHLKVLQVAAGYAHTMVLTDQGYLYGAGYNDRGQLGLG